ncbi:MAG: phosphoribosyltransferase [Gemmatimonadales bacterium]
MTRRFVDRTDAGRRLAGELLHLAARPRLLVLGLPRGGVPVAAPVAEALEAPLDVLVVRKLGVPGHEELAMGAVASGGAFVLNPEVITPLRISRETIERVAAAERRELERRERTFRGERPFPDLQGATVVLVDDGVATGSTMLAAVRALKQRNPKAIVVAAPVMSAEAHATLASEADECVTLATPEPFWGVGAWYEDFTQTSDAEVVGVLDAARHGESENGEVVAHGVDS